MDARYRNRLTDDERREPDELAYAKDAIYPSRNVLAHARKIRSRALFGVPHLLATVEAYRHYRENAFRFIDTRNHRMSEYVTLLLVKNP